jgi:hypothetical protein
MKMTAVGVSAVLTGEWMVGKNTGRRQMPSPEEVSRLAYRLYELRGRRDGHAVDDWLAAEEELIRHYR